MDKEGCKNPNPRRMKRGVSKKKEQRVKEKEAKMGAVIKKAVLGIQIELTTMEILWKFNVQ